MHSAPVHRARLRASAELATSLNRSPSLPQRRYSAPARRNTRLLAAVNNDISRSGQTPLFQAVSLSRYTRTQLTLAPNEFSSYPFQRARSFVLSLSDCIYSIVDIRASRLARNIFPTYLPAMEIWNCSLIVARRNTLKLAPIEWQVRNGSSRE